MKITYVMLPIWRTGIVKTSQNSGDFLNFIDKFFIFFIIIIIIIVMTVIIIINIIIIIITVIVTLIVNSRLPRS